MLTEQSHVTWSVTKHRSIEILTVTVIMRDGVEISRINHRHCLAPGDDLANQDPDVVIAANAVWTTQVIDNWNALNAESIEPME